MNKDLKKEYENRSYATQASMIQKQSQRDKSLAIEDQSFEEEIQVKRETTEVKVTYAAGLNSTNANRSQSNISYY